jgi:uncharacterized protein YigE (DUF2233 family)
LTEKSARFRRVLWWPGALLVLLGCMLPQATVTPPPPTDPPTSEPVPDGWELMASGLERRVYVPENNALARVLAVRVDPARFAFRAHYRPAEPLWLREWQELLPDAVALINANFFDPDYRVLGLLVADGVVYGQSYQGRGGTFVVQNGVPRMRSNILEPYTGEALEQAVQAFPMLVVNGQAAYTSDAPDRITRRTVIGQDTQGRILLIVTPAVGMRLADLSAFLASTDMDLLNAVNLDGGGSTMMHLSATPDFSLVSFDAVPAVLAVYPR